MRFAEYLKENEKTVMFQLLKKGGTEKYLFGDSGFLLVSKEPGLRVLVVRVSGVRRC